MVAADRPRRPRRRRPILEQGEACRARARHTRQRGAFEGRQGGQNVRNFRGQRAGASLQIVSPFAQDFAGWSLDPRRRRAPATERSSMARLGRGEAERTPRASRPRRQDWRAPRTAAAIAGSDRELRQAPSSRAPVRTRHTGTSAPAARAAAQRRGSSGVRAFSCASARNAAAASDEPPPSPAATGRFLCK